MISHSRPVFGKAFEDALVRIAQSGHVAMGDETLRLEKEISGCVRKEYAVAVDSGTAAIELALRALSSGSSVKKVGIPSFTCSSVLYAVLAAGCEPVCMDCGEDLRLIPEQALKQATALDAVILVHPFGMVEPLVAETWPCPVIEDIAQAAGARLNNKPVGSFGDITIASFYAAKPWGGAYGGMVASDDKALCETVRAMRDPDKAMELNNYAGHHQLSDLHAAMALVRLEISDHEQDARKRLACEMDGWFEHKTLIPVAGIQQGNHYRYIVRTDGEANAVIDKLFQHGVTAARPVNMPISRLLGMDFPGAEKAWLDAVSLPIFSDMSKAEFHQLKAAVESCMH